MLNSNTYKKIIGFVFLILLLTGCSTRNAENPPPAVRETQSWLAAQLNVSVDEIEILSWEEVEWTDSCYGLGGPAESCLAEPIPGWQVMFEVNGQAYEVRSEETGTIARSPQL